MSPWLDHLPLASYEPRVEVYKPDISTHGKWCHWLWVNGCLDRAHRRCMNAEECVALSVSRPGPQPSLDANRPQRLSDTAAGATHRHR